MSVYNGERHLREAIESILNQTFTDFEFIIIDDGSSDGSLNIIRSYEDPRIKLICNTKNIGLTDSLNIGVRIARGTFIARMDADDISLPTRFEEQIVYLKKNPGISILGTDVQLINHKGDIIRRKNNPLFPTRPNLISWTLFFRSCVNHPTVMARKNVYEKIGGYRTSFRYAQDYDLWLRAAEEHSISNIPRELVKLRKHSESLSKKYINEQEQHVLSAVSQAISSFLQISVKENDVRLIRDKNHIGSKENVYSSILLVYKLYRSFIIRKHTSLLEKFSITIHMSKLIGRTIRYYLETDPLFLTSAISFLISINPFLFFQVLFLWPLGVAQNLFLQHYLKIKRGIVSRH